MQYKSLSHKKIGCKQLSLIALKPHAEVINHEISFAHKMSLQTVRHGTMGSSLRLPKVFQTIKKVLVVCDDVQKHGEYPGKSTSNKFMM